MTHENLSLRKCWKLLGATLREQTLPKPYKNGLPWTLLEIIKRSSIEAVTKIVKQRSIPEHHVVE